jgi:hypothetical protein
MKERGEPANQEKRKDNHRLTHGFMIGEPASRYEGKLNKKMVTIN